MALTTNPEASAGIFQAIKGALGLFGDTNKEQGILAEGTSPVPQDPYESTLSDEEIIKLTSEWKKAYAVYYDPIDKTQVLAFEYWIGKHKVDETTPQAVRIPQAAVDNQIFPALETFLPIATRANPDPLVSADPSEIGQHLAKSIKAALVHEADRQKLRRKLARMTRNWAINRVGIAKIMWNVHTKQIETEILNSRRMIFDKDGHVDEGGNFVGEYLGEKKKATAQRLSDLFPKKKADIVIKAKGKMGTKLEYYEWWWKGDDVFYTLEDVVLGKYKNPNWNYDIAEEKNGEGEVERESAQGTNHHEERKAPYVFLSIFSTGLHPHDDTSLILQNIPVQDVINKRWRQIDRNVESQNNGIVVSGRSFTEEQAAQAASALRKGVAIRVPDGNVNDAIKRDAAPQLPRDIFQNLNDARSELRNIFGTAGSTPQGTETQDTVRGKILVSQQDSSRIGGGVTEQIEQVADTIYNWWAQFMFVYYDEEHFVLASGIDGGSELITIKNSAFPLLQSLNITVKEGSLIPKDPLTQRNEAIDLWSANAIDPLNFYKKLDFPDPAAATQQLILWQMLQRGQIAPQQYLPSFQIPQTQVMPGQSLPGAELGTGGPAVSPPPPSVPPEGPQTPVPQSPPAVEAQGRQLLRAIPIR